MSQNRTSTDFPGTSTGGQNEGSTMGSSQTGSDFGSQSGSSTGSSTGTSGSSTGNGGAAATATARAQEYGTKITEAATQAKDFVSDKMTVVGDKLKELQGAELGEITENAKDYARKNPGQAILISAAAGLLVGLILRGRR
jgi:ElaB/YqjD/DUF883 family membrane-anchored ribosome-binding protein